MRLTSKMQLTSKMRLQTSLLLVVLLATTVAGNGGLMEPQPVDMSCQRDNTNFLGANMAMFESTGFEACANYCRIRLNGCKSITFRKSNKQCFVKNVKGGEFGPNPDNDFISMNMECSNEPVNMSCLRWYTDFVGANLRDFITTGVEACANFCRDASKCKAITFITDKHTNEKRCYLKSIQGGEKGPNPNNYAFSMNMDCDNKPVDMSCKRIGRDFEGADLRDFKTTGFEACANYCRDAYNCKAITFITQEEYVHFPMYFPLNVKNRCYLKYRQGGENGPILKKNRDSMNLDCDNKPVDMSCKRYNTEFWGADLRDFLCGGVQACANFCRDTENCKAVTYNTYENWCYLKHKQGGENGPNPETGLISMNMDCDNERVDMSCQRDNTEYEGYDLREFKSSGFEACANFCRDSEDCRSFAFVKYSRWCRLKDKKFDIWRVEENVNMKSMNVPC